MNDAGPAERWPASWKSYLDSAASVWVFFFLA